MQDKYRVLKPFRDKVTKVVYAPAEGQNVYKNKDKVRCAELVEAGYIVKEESKESAPKAPKESKDESGKAK